MNVYIFVRQYNDIDHIVPVIYDIGERHPDVTVVLVNAGLSGDFLNDYRVKTLGDRFGIRYCNLSDFSPLYSRVFRTYLRIQDSFLSSGPSPFMEKVFRKIVIQNIYLRLMERCVAGFDFRNILIDNGREHVFGFDHGISSFTKKALSFAKKNNIRTFAYMHGVDMTENYLIADNWNRPDMLVDSLKAFNVFDKVFVNNDFYREKFIRKGVEEERLRVVGVPRFTDHWNRILDEITPRADLPEVGEGRLKVVMMLSKGKYNIFEQEVWRMIKLLLQFENLFLVIKPHTREFAHNFQRDLGIDPGKTQNLLIADDDTHSHQLIRWADLIIFNLSSIVLDALLQDRPSLFLKCTIANRLVFEGLMRDWSIYCRDDLVHWIRRMLEDRGARPYTREEARSCLDLIANDGDGKLFERYEREILTP